MPANGTEGAEWEVSWCAHCAHDAAFREDMDKEGCPILAEAIWGNRPEWQWRNGEPICTRFMQDPANPLRYPFTLEMFA